MREPTSAEAEQREPVLNPVDRVSEMLFGLFMALTFIGAVSVAGRGEAQVRTLFITALGCNLAWGLVDAVMYLVRTATTRGRSHSLMLAVRAAPDADAGCRIIEAALPKTVAGLMTRVEVESVRTRVLALAQVPPRPELNRGDALAAVAIFLLVVLATFPVVLPFLFFDSAVLAKNVSRGVALLMLFGGGLVLGRYAGYGSWRSGLIMAGLGAGLVVAINALGG